MTLVGETTQVDLVNIKPPTPRNSLAVFHVVSEPVITLEFRTSGTLVGVYEMTLANPRDKKEILAFFKRTGVSVTGADVDASEFAPKQMKNIRLRTRIDKNSEKDFKEQHHEEEHRKENKHERKEKLTLKKTS